LVLLLSGVWLPKAAKAGRKKRRVVGPPNPCKKHGNTGDKRGNREEEPVILTHRFLGRPEKVQLDALAINLLLKAANKLADGRLQAMSWDCIWFSEKATPGFWEFGVG